MTYPYATLRVEPWWPDPNLIVERIQQFAQANGKMTPDVQCEERGGYLEVRVEDVIVPETFQSALTWNGDHSAQHWVSESTFAYALVPFIEQYYGQRWNHLQNLMISCEDSEGDTYSIEFPGNRGAEPHPVQIRIDLREV